MATEIFDVCVIGTGAGGGVMIQELTAAGFRVVALQRGPFLKPGDFDDDERRAAFRPERFLRSKPDNYAWIPFGGGVRKCLGGPFALLEMRTVLRTILEEHRFVPTDEPDEPLARRNVTIVPGRGAVVRLERRAPVRLHVPPSWVLPDPREARGMECSP